MRHRSLAACVLLVLALLAGGATVLADDAGPAGRGDVGSTPASGATGRATATETANDTAGDRFAGFSTWSTAYDAQGVAAFDDVDAAERGYLLSGTLRNGSRYGVVVSQSADGRRRWSHRFAVESGPFLAEPRHDGFVTSANGTLTAWRENGTPRWRIDLAEPARVTDLTTANETVVATGSVVVAVRADGTVAWQNSWETFESRAVAPSANGYLVAGCTVENGTRYASVVRVAANGTPTATVAVSERSSCLSTAMAMPNGGHVVGGWRATGDGRVTTGLLARVSRSNIAIWRTPLSSGTLSRVVDVGLAPASGVGALVRGENGTRLFDVTAVGDSYGATRVDDARAVAPTRGKRFVLAGADGRTATASVVDLYEQDASLTNPSNGLVAADRVTHLDATALLYQYADAYRWDFDGDGDVNDATVLPKTPHRFAETGRTYDLTVVAFDTTRQTEVRTVRLRTVPNDRPNVSIAPRSVRADRNVTFTATVDDRVGRTTVNWTFADGVRRNGTSVVRRFGATGDHEVSVRVTDEYGAQRQVVTTVTVSRPTILERATRLVDRYGGLAVQGAVALVVVGAVVLGLRQRGG